MRVASRLERVLTNPEIYEIEAAGGVAKISAHGGACLDRCDIRRIQSAVDVAIYYIREDGVYVAEAMA